MPIPFAPSGFGPDFRVVSLCATLIAVIGWQYWRLRKWRRAAERCRHERQQEETRCGILAQHNAQLAAGSAQRRSQLLDWLAARRSVTAYVGEFGAVIGLKQVRKQPSYLRDDAYEQQPHLGQPHNVFEPVPRPPARRADVVRLEPVLVLTNNVYDHNGSFEVVVFRPADRLRLRNERFLARIAVTVHTMAREYNIDVYTAPAKESTGATSLALDYVIARASANDITALNGKLLDPATIHNEGHRSRLYSFYRLKYQFQYDPVTDALLKIL